MSTDLDLFGDRDVQRSSSYGETLNAEDDEVHVYDHFRAFDQFQNQNPKSKPNGQNERDHTVGIYCLIFLNKRL